MSDEADFDDLYFVRAPGGKPRIAMFISEPCANSIAMDLTGEMYQSIAALRESFGLEPYVEMIFVEEGEADEPDEPDEPSPADAARLALEHQLIDALEDEWQLRIGIAQKLGPGCYELVGQYNAACAALGIPPRPQT